MSSTKELKNYALLGAVIKNDIDSARKLLIEGANPNYCTGEVPVMNFAINKNQIDMIKLLVEYPVVVDETLMEYILKPENDKIAYEFVSHLIHHKKNVKFIQRIFDDVVWNEDCQDSLALDLLKLLLENGLPIDDYVYPDYVVGGAIEDLGLTPLQTSIMNEKASFVSHLVELGASVNKKTGDGRPLLFLSAQYLRDEYVFLVTLLLENGAQINEKSAEGKTALHKACQWNKQKFAEVFIEWGADVNACDNNGETPLKFANKRNIKNILIKELAMLRFNRNFICPENKTLVKSTYYLRETCTKCLRELERMKNLKFYNNFSLNDVLQFRRRRIKKLIFLTKNEEFVSAFRLFRSGKLLNYYGKDLDNIFEEAVRNRDILVAEHKKLSSIFKDYLPDLVVHQISCFLNEHLFDNNSVK